jgi:hypothetical protein
MAIAILVGCAGSGAAQQPDPDRPLPSVVAVAQRTGRPIPLMVRRYVEQYARGTLPANVQFPLANATSESVRTITNLRSDVLVKWLDPLSRRATAGSLRFGANNDFIAYFGDGWDADWTGGAVNSAPQFKGDGRSGWLWTNHEFVFGSSPTQFGPPTAQHLTLARFLRAAGVFTHDVDLASWNQSRIDTYIQHYKKQLGGSWYRVRFDSATQRWTVVPSAGAVRYDATSQTLLTLTGQPLRALDRDDAGAPLPPQVVAGVFADCSGGQTPWGTVITAEENVQGYYGEVETCWNGSQKFIAGTGFDAGSLIQPFLAPNTAAEFGRASSGLHNRDVYGYLVEIDPGLPSDLYYLSAGQPGGDGLGHRKIGSAGRAHWENATFAVGKNLKLVPGEPIVFYSGDDRPGGRVFKFVSSRTYTAGMTRAEVRALLDDGALYVAHFAGLDNTTGLTLKATGQSPTEAAPGTGRWIRLSTASTDVAPNADALGSPGKTVGAALRDLSWNRIGGFRDDNDVRLALFTASNKIGVMELNRPEDVEWNPRDPSGTPRLYISFTGHGLQVALDQNGVVFDPEHHATASPFRYSTGAVFVLEEANPSNPSQSGTFRYFAAWRGTQAAGLFDAAHPDNLMIDGDGGVWFATDGNISLNGTADGLYYLDLDPAHRTGSSGITQATYGKAFRIVAMPSDAEATGPAFSSNQGTIFLSVQHPGAGRPSSWPPR